MPLSEHGAWKELMNQHQEQQQEMESLKEEMKAKFVNPDNLDNVLSEYQDKEDFQRREKEILEEIKKAIQDKKPPEQDDPYMDGEQWDGLLADKIRGVIEKEIQKSS